MTLARGNILHVIIVRLAAKLSVFTSSFTSFSTDAAALSRERTYCGLTVYHWRAL